MQMLNLVLPYPRHHPCQNSALPNTLNRAVLNFDLQWSLDQ